MPKVEPKIIQKECDQGKVRPVYWIFGPERMKSRELVKRIQKLVHQGEPANDFNCEKLDAGEVQIETVIDAAQSFSMMGGTKLLIIRNADELKNLEPLTDYLKALDSTDPAPASDIPTVTLFLAKGFDGRKKTSKIIQDYAAVVPCEEVADQDREPWIDYLAKRRGVTLKADERLVLRGLDPWSLDIVDQELAKIELVSDADELRKQVLMTGVDSNARDEFIDAIFCRDKVRALKWVHLFSEDMDVQLPILGLISWNMRHLKVMALEQETRTRSGEKRNPYLQRNLDRWKPHWNLNALQEFEHDLFGIDFSLKNTRLLGRGLWTSLLIDSSNA